MAKIFQSLIAKYDIWDSKNDLFTQVNENNFIISDIFLEINREKYDWLLEYYNNDKYMFNKGIFYLGIYLIRMIPFLLLKSTNHALFGLIMATYYINI